MVLASPTDTTLWYILVLNIYFETRYEDSILFHRDSWVTKTNLKSNFICYGTSIWSTNNYNVLLHL